MIMMYKYALAQEMTGSYDYMVHIVITDKFGKGVTDPDIKPYADRLMERRFIFFHHALSEIHLTVQEMAEQGIDFPIIRVPISEMQNK